MNSEFIRLCKLEYLAENDSIYQVWYRSYLDSKDLRLRRRGQNGHAKEGQSGLSAYAVSGREIEYSILLPA